jgi:sortase A
MASDAASKLKRTELILLVIGIKCVLAWGGLRLYSVTTSRAAVRTFEAGERTGAVVHTNSPSTVDVRAWSSERIAAYQRSLGELAVAPIAVLRIQKLGLVVPVFNGTDDLILNRGVGRVLGTAQIGQPGNMAIAGHRDGFFRKLGEVSDGDVIEVERLGSVDRYVVTATRVVTPEDISVLKPSASPVLTLITCFPFYFIGHAPRRYIVTAVFDPHEDAVVAQTKTPHNFSHALFEKQ